MASRSSTMTLDEPFEEPTRGATSGALLDPSASIRHQRRRHSSYHPQEWSAEDDNIQVLVDRFLAELARRLDFLESYGNLKLDNGIERAYSTLCAVRDACSHVSDGAIEAGRRRAKVLVDTLEQQYKGALAARQTMEQKVQEGVKLMESFLAEFESRAYAMREAGISSLASDMLDGGRRRVDDGIVRAREVVDEGIVKALRAKENIEAAVEDAIKRARENGLITYEELPFPWRINPHILRGYRFSETKVDCIRSVVSISNELVNIWSHLIGLVIVLAIAFYFYPSSINFSASSSADIVIAVIFFAAATKCLTCSIMWHTMNSIAEQTLMERFACVDYTGISLLVAASIMTTEYTAFYCEPWSRWFYLISTGILGVAGSILAWHPTFNRADMSWGRVAFYVSLSATGFLPIMQLSMTRGLDWVVYFYAPIAKSVLVYLVGALLYAAKMPERFWPSKFDYCGNSHNIWHIAVLGGILYHYQAMHTCFKAAFEMAATEQCSIY